MNLEDLEDLVERALAEEARDMSAVPDVDALVALGMQARRRHWQLVGAWIVAAVVVGAVVVGPMVRNTVKPAPVSGVPSAPVGSGTGTSFFFGSVPEVPVTFTMPAGWEAEHGWVIKPNSDPMFGLVFTDVANIYTDGCQWRLVDPPVGPTVDDLVAAHANVPGIQGPAQDVTVDGFDGKLIQYTVPDYKEAECIADRFGIFREDNGEVGAAPNIWAQAPRQRNRLWILDVNGTRLVILAWDPGNMSARDRTDVGRILSSLHIG